MADALDPVTGLLNIGGKLIDRLFPDPGEKAKAQIALLELSQRGDLAQIAVNEAEAKNASVFVSGWRPAIGWICGAACAWNWLGLPVAKFGAALAGVQIAVNPADLTDMLPVLLGMLGLSGFRSLEKINGVAAK